MEGFDFVLEKIWRTLINASDMWVQIVPRGTFFYELERSLEQG